MFRSFLFVRPVAALKGAADKRDGDWFECLGAAFGLLRGCFGVAVGCLAVASRLPSGRFLALRSLAIPAPGCEGADVRMLLDVQDRRGVAVLRSPPRRIKRCDTQARPTPAAREPAGE
ncbi:MAG: hypothetical protein EPN70_19955 [Paraburkholderia sp.]|uniref:hypothetical protein n=1 Tax=Paraburkholderia sp. TaxID=1926495 RepID=UPI00122264C4|nr:hypothetical protein [Paraburkholderia sp.]TAM01299.1 MAG: hypothetical protein EPN70_19955 [Paraburkholderia sp.]TAM31070.1 MAG: hypothetical protein EPN59_06905 [Paraburkholderia sp.]